MKSNFIAALSILALSACSSSNNTSTISDEDFDADAGEYCPIGSLYEEADDFCYVDCEGLDDHQCDALEEDVFGEFDELVLDNYSGANIDDVEQREAKAQYEIKSDLLLSALTNTEPENESKFQEIWTSANKILPRAKMLEAFSQYHVDSDGVDETLAYVTLDDNQPGKWIIAFDDADYKSPSDKEFIHTTVHEFGHIVFLGKDQVDLSATGACENYAISEGCTNAGSYINKFYQAFWADIFDEHAAVVDDEEGLGAFYEKYKDRFVSEYAVTNPVEDAAEIFTNFVLRDKPTSADTVVNAKILMMHDSDALVSLRSEMRGKLTVTQARARRELK